MNATSETSPPPICAASSSTTSSPVSASGPSPCVSLDGQMTSPSGPAPVLVNLSARQANERGLLTSGTYGPRGIGSSSSIDLQRSLASRLRHRTASLGSTLFRLTWKVKATPAGRSFSQLVASVPRTSDQESGSWPTPTASRGDYQKKGESTFLKLAGAAKLASWSTPLAKDADGHTLRFKSHSLPSQSRLAGWATPVATELGNTLENYLAMKANMKSGKRTAITHPSLQAQLTDLGPEQSGSTAGTASSGHLNPAHSRWLMGLPSAWDACGVTAMQSLPKRRRKSSRPTDGPGGADGLR